MESKTIVLSKKRFDSSTGGMYPPLISNSGEYAFLPIPEPAHMTGPDYEGVDYASLPTDFPDFDNLKDLLTSKNKLPKHGAHLDPDLTMVHSVENWKPAFGQRGAAQGYLRNHGVGTDSKGTLFLFFSRFKPWAKTNKGLTEGYYIYGWLEVGRTLNPSEEERELEYHPHFAAEYREATNNILYVATEHITGTSLPGAGMFRRLSKNRKLSFSEEKDLLTWKLPSCCFESFSRLKNYKKLEDSSCLAVWPQSFGQAAVCSLETSDNQKAVEKVRQWAINKIKAGIENVGIKQGCL